MWPWPPQSHTFNEATAVSIASLKGGHRTRPLCPLRICISFFATTCFAAISKPCGTPPAAVPVQVNGAEWQALDSQRPRTREGYNAELPQHPAVQPHDSPAPLSTGPLSGHGHVCAFSTPPNSTARQLPSSPNCLAGSHAAALPLPLEPPEQLPTHAARTGAGPGVHQLHALLEASHRTRDRWVQRHQQLLAQVTRRCAEQGTYGACPSPPAAGTGAALVSPQGIVAGGRKASPPLSQTRIGIRWKLKTRTSRCVE